jgi:hypothetical protein
MTGKPTTPLVETKQVKVTLPENPPPPVAVTVYVAEPPGVTLLVAGSAARLREGLIVIGSGEEAEPL